MRGRLCWDETGNEYPISGQELERELNLEKNKTTKYISLSAASF